MNYGLYFYTWWCMIEYCSYMDQYFPFAIKRCKCSLGSEHVYWNRRHFLHFAGRVVCLSLFNASQACLNCRIHKDLRVLGKRKSWFVTESIPFAWGVACFNVCTSQYKLLRRITVWWTLKVESVITRRYIENVDCFKHFHLRPFKSYIPDIELEWHFPPRKPWWKWDSTRTNVVIIAK